MSRKPLPEGLSGPQKSESLNSLITQLEDPRSLMSFLPPDAQSAFASIPEEFLSLDEETLLKKFDEEKGWVPSQQVETLRNNFWLEYDRVFLTKKEDQMSLHNVYYGVVSRTAFYKIMHTQPHTLAFLLAKPLEYQKAYDSLQALSNRKFHQILSLPIKEGGKLNIKLLELQLKAAAMVDLRNKGGYLQRSETKNLTMLKQETNHTYSQTLNMKINEKTASSIEADIKEKLKMLEEESGMMPSPPTPRFDKTEVVDAVYTDVTKNAK